MVKDRINRDELADKLVEKAAEAEDPLRTMAELITGFLMEAEVATKVGAEAHQRSEQRTTQRHGYRDRRWDTRLGTLQLQAPKVREGGYVPRFIEGRKRSEQALISVIQEAVVKGVDTSRFRGTCYRAADWQAIGTTAGRGHRAPTFERTRPVKRMLGFPLDRKFRQLLCG